MDDAYIFGVTLHACYIFLMSQNKRIFRKKKNDNVLGNFSYKNCRTLVVKSIFQILSTWICALVGLFITGLYLSFTSLYPVTIKKAINLPNAFDRNCFHRTLELAFSRYSKFSGGACPQTVLLASKVSPNFSFSEGWTV